MEGIETYTVMKSHVFASTQDNALHLMIRQWSKKGEKDLSSYDSAMMACKSRNTKMSMNDQDYEVYYEYYLPVDRIWKTNHTQ